MGREFKWKKEVGERKRNQKVSCRDTNSFIHVSKIYE